MKVVVVAGYFDPIHEGHLDHIESAKTLGDVLVIIAATEEQCAKKHGHYFHSWEGKVRLLKALGADDVVPNVDTDGSCAKTLQNLKPDIFAKGGEASANTLPIAEITVCEKMGCRIVYGCGRRLNRSSIFWAMTERMQAGC